MAHLITQYSDFVGKNKAIASMVSLGKTLPENVFCEAYGYYRFFHDFNFSMSEYFIGVVIACLDKNNPRKANLIVVDPDPKECFYPRAKHYGSLEIEFSDSSLGVVELLERTSLDTCEGYDSISILSNRFVLFPETREWCVWADREFEVVAVGFKSRAHSKVFIEKDRDNLSMDSDEVVSKITKWIFLENQRELALDFQKIFLQNYRGEL